jgi:hypothetical protein
MVLARPSGHALPKNLVAIETIAEYLRRYEAKTEIPVKTTAPTEAVGCTIDGGRKAKTEILTEGDVDEETRFRVGIV